MEVTQNPSAALATDTSTSTAATPADDASTLTADFETFLKLLTTQLTNQDPSKPIDSTEFVAQLASFSAVEQQINTNSKLDGLIGAMNASGSANMANWLGKDVRSTATASYDGTPVDVYFDIPGSATAANLIVKDANGVTVHKSPLSVTDTTKTWDGTDFTNSPVAHGEYTFTVESIESGVSMGEAKAETFSPVVEARMNNGSVQLVFGDGSVLDASSVEAVRS